MKATRESMLLYIVTDRAWLQGRSLASQVEESVQAGATFVQLREKELDEGSFLEEARTIKRITDRYGVPFVINDNVEVALQSGADGVHIGQGDEPADEVRRRIGPGKILGVSARTVEEALKAEQDGADYLGVGAVFPTSTKLDACDVSRETLEEICRRVSIPVVAIGGISQGNVLQLSGSGVDGIAVVSAVFAQPDIAQATRGLRALAERMVAR